MEFGRIFKRTKQENSEGLFRHLKERNLRIIERIQESFTNHRISALAKKKADDLLVLLKREDRSLTEEFVREVLLNLDASNEEINQLLNFQ